MRNLLLLILVFVCSKSTGQNQGDTVRVSTEKLKECVVVIKEDLFSDKLGSGILMKHEKSFFLVTAEHVKKITNSKSYISYGNIDKDTASVRIQDLIERSLPIWRSHPKADLSILKLSNKKGHLDSLKSHFLDSKYFVQSIPDSTINNSIDFYIVGFPLGYGAYPNFNPLVKTSNLASKTIQARRSKRLYGKNDVFNNKLLIHLLLEDPSVGGFSGGPVYYPGGNFDVRLVYGSTIPKCVGIVSGTIGDSTGGKMAVITPAHLIFDLIYN